MRRYRVIQCGAGMAGGEALKAILDNPRLELAGLLVARPAMPAVTPATSPAVRPSA